MRVCHVLDKTHSTKKVKADITTNLHLSDEDTDIVYKSPDRPNIFIQILKRESSEYEMSLGMAY
jgi:superfamily II DNA helicase RecQ